MRESPRTFGYSSILARGTLHAWRLICDAAQIGDWGQFNSIGEASWGLSCACSSLECLHLTLIQGHDSIEMDTSAPPPVDGNVSNGTMASLNGAPSNGNSNGHVVTNAPGMSAGLLCEGPTVVSPLLTWIFSRNSFVRSPNPTLGCQSSRKVRSSRPKTILQIPFLTSLGEGFVQQISS